MKKITTQLFIGLMSAAFLNSCTPNQEANDLQEAQLCLNKAGQTEAMNCVSKISSNTSENAYKLRCAAIFISKGFGTPASFATAIDQMNGSTSNGSCTGGTCSGSLVAMSTLNFGTDTSAAAQAVSECTQSGVSIYAQISSIFKLGTDLVSLAGGATSVAAIEGQIGNLSSAQVGQLVETVYTTGCASIKADDPNQKYCTEISNAMGSGNYTTTQIGDCLKAKLDNPNYSGPLCP